MKTFKLKIVTPKGIYQEVDIRQLNLRTTAGQIGVLADHLPLASGVDISQMDYIDEKGKKQIFSLAGGFVYVNEKETTIIVNAIESSEEIDLKRAQEAKMRAEKRLQDKDADILRAEIALRKAVTRINIKEGN